MKKKTEEQEFSGEIGVGQNFLDTLLNSVLNPVYHIDSEGFFTNCNEAFQKQILGLPGEEILGLPGEEILGYTLHDLIQKMIPVFSRTYPEEGLGVLVESLESCHREDMDFLKNGGGSGMKEMVLFCADGIKRSFLVNRATYSGPDGKVLGMVCFLQDITAIKRAQESARKSEERHRAIAEQTGQLMFEECVKTGRIDWTGAIEEITGYTSEEFKEVDRSTFYRLIHPEDRGKVRARLYHCYESGDRFHGEFRFKRKGGNYIHLEGSAAFLKDSEECVFRSLGVLKDITESILAREELKNSEERFRTVAEYTGQLIFDYDLLTGKNNSAGAIEKLTGYSPDEFGVFDLSDWAGHIHPEDRERVLNTHKKFLGTGKMQHIEYRFRKKDGSYIDVEDQVVGLLAEKGRVCRILGTMKDVSERNQALKNLEKSEEKYRILAERAGRMIFDLNLQSGEVLWSGSIKEITGYEESGFSRMDHFSLGQLVHPDDRDIILKNVLTSLENGENSIWEYRLKRKDGNYVYVEHSNLYLKDENGIPYRVLGVISDITENRLAQEKLRKSEERFRIATEQTMHVVYDYDIDNDRNDWLGAVQQLTGYTAEEFQRVNIGMWAERIHPDDRERAVSAHHSAFNNGSMYHEVYRFLKKGGSYFYAEDSGVFLKNEEGRIYRMVGVIRDITERKLAEEELSRSEERYRLIAERTGLLLYDDNYAEGRVNVSGAIRGVMGYTSVDSAKFCEDEWVKLVHPADRERVEALHKNCRKNGGSFHAEYRMKRKDGRYFHAEDEGVYLKDEKGQVCKAVGVIKDISERKEAEETLEKIREIRKKEIHHRIKNNLQVISSLLSLQADHFSDARVKEAFLESQDRINAMALIHEELYESKEKDMERFDFTAYLRKLTAWLFQSYNVGSRGISLDLDLEENIFMNMDTAIPLGMIVNELVSNSLKHAFPGDRGGEIRIKFCSKNIETSENEYSIDNGCKRSPPPGISEKECCESTGCVLVVSDDGKGFPENFDFENSQTLGLQLVHILVNQIEGRIELKRSPGTEVKIVF